MMPCEFDFCPNSSLAMGHGKGSTIQSTTEPCDIISYPFDALWHPDSVPRDQIRSYMVRKGSDDVSIGGLSLRQVSFWLRLNAEELTPHLSPRPAMVAPEYIIS